MKDERGRIAKAREAVEVRVPNSYRPPAGWPSPESF